MATQTTPEPQALAPAAPRDTSRSRALLERARTLFPGGVNSPVRAFGGVGGEPFFVARGEGARIWDADGNAYLDYVLSWGPLVLGHAPRVVLDALHETMQRGTSFGIPPSSRRSSARRSARACRTSRCCASCRAAPRRR
jgi:glutamate-1-semialdehyde 2,1-aminomutase